MNHTNVHVDWKYSGKPDGFFGTGVTGMEQAVVWFFGLVGTGILGWAAFIHPLPWAWWQYLLASLLALDVLGGVVANALNTCKRFYHAPLQSEETGFNAIAKNHLVFTALHIHPMVAGLIFGRMDWSYGLFWYIVLVLCSVIVLQCPLYLRRPVAFGLIMTAILLNQYMVSPVAGFEWLVPALFLKIVYGHLVREEPYRP